MNRTKIEWCDYTWNPVTGCLHGCSYCYARRIAKRFGKSKSLCELNIAGSGEVFPAGFAPTFYPERLGEPKKLKKAAKIFTVSMGDLFGDWVPQEWIDEVFNTVRECPQHTFIFITKNPLRMRENELPFNAWAGVTIDGMEADPPTMVSYIRHVRAPVKFVSFEPLLSYPVGVWLWGIDWIIIGAQTGPGAKPPDPGWVKKIINAAKAVKAAVFLKDNLKWHNQIREFPVN